MRPLLLAALIAGGQPLRAQDQWLPRAVPPPVMVRLRGAALERHVQRTVKAALGSWVDDVDVDVDDRRGRITVEVELTHPAGLSHLQRLLYAMPELAGCQIQVEVKHND